MPLLEIKTDVLKQLAKDQEFNFFQDNKNDIQIFVWHIKSYADEKLSKFQVKHKNHIFEWTEGRHLKYGNIEEEQSGIGVKKAQVIMMNEKINIQELNYLKTYLGNEENKIIKSILAILINYIH
ncbi:MAG: hypothetical protein OEZ13_05325 [Spirochaetia bacterium]|nr:hypothetical protein [Spirochaetia bacterium]